MRRGLVIAVIAALGLLGLLPAAQALEFVAVSLESGGRVLLMQDCEQTQTHPCRRDETQFYRGDANTLERALSGGRFAEVWLNSGGGDSEEGQRVGFVLRKYRMAVRIRDGHSCASACTVAFLGGVLRTVEPGGRYLVHARSAVLNGIDEDTMARFLSSPESELERYVLRQRREARSFIATRLMYLQTMLGGVPDRDRYEAVAQQGIALRPAHLGSASFAEEVARIRVEGRPAVHAVIMSNEKASFTEALGNIREHVSELGPRAAAAHRMMEAMFATTIIRTADMTPETLVKLGFVTPEIGR